ncbi:MAG: hypothetical protein ACE5O2_10940, partial [Armatimonadota bacterium]
EAKRSAIGQGEARLARADMACGGDWGDLASRASEVRAAGRRCAGPAGTAAEAAAYAEAAEQLLRAVQQREDGGYLQRVTEAADAGGAALAFDFGGTRAEGPWRLVGVDSAYSPETGFGWLPRRDDSAPTPEEVYYAAARKYGGRFVTGLTASTLLFWPYKQPAPTPLQRNIASGAPSRFRVDVPAGTYTVRVVTTNPSWTNRNFLVSGMVSVNGAVRLLDAAHDRGAIVSREFSTSAPDGRLEFTFGGPTGWAVAAVVITPAAEPERDPQAGGGLRSWRVSPRYPNPDWYAITQVMAAPEKRLAEPPQADWTRVAAGEDGLPVVDLGTNEEADVGDVVYAATLIESPAARQALLHFGASSQAQLWLNGVPIGYVPNEKGVRRDEYVVVVDLKAGRNVLVVKLQRFWERHWTFYAALTESE